MDRDELLERVVAEGERNGLTGRSLRDLASAVGTSHRMLIHHFGSQAELVAAIVDSIAADEHRIVTAATQDDPLEAVAALWERTSAPANHPHLRLLFSSYGRAIEGADPFTRLLPGLVDDWVGAANSSKARDGECDEAAIRARVGLAVVRGLLLDLMTTHDELATQRAFDCFISLMRTDPTES
jgi:AcrR family transcriptional regulator